MVYQEYPIADPLRPYVKVIWSMESEETWAPPMRILPDSCVELVIHFNQPYKTTFSDNKAEVQPQSFVVAQMKYSLAEIAYLTGFSDQSHFNRIFKSHTGKNPSVYRKNLEKQ